MIDLKIIGFMLTGVVIYQKIYEQNMYSSRPPMILGFGSSKIFA